MPNLEALTIYSQNEMDHVPMLQSKFIHLRHLSMVLIGALLHPVYDYLSLASFLDAAPSLETFNLHLWHQGAENASVFVDPTDLRRELQHHNLRSLRITGFSSVKSLVELTCNILESVTSLECLTLESTQSTVLTVVINLANAYHLIAIFSGKVTGESWLSEGILSLGSPPQ